MTRESSQDITKLCESWWAKLADSNKAEQQRYAEEMLKLLGWPAPEPFELDAPSLHGTHVSYLLRLETQPTLMACFVMPGALEPPSALAERGLDFCETTRRVVDATRAAKTPYVLITDLNRSYLYDVRNDELLLYADTPSDFDEELTEIVGRAGFEQNAMSDVRRPPRSYAARQLREWRQYWRRQLCAESPLLHEDTAALVVDRLILTGILFDREVLGRPYQGLKKRFDSLMVQVFDREITGCGKELNALFDRFWRNSKAEIFAPTAPLQEILERDRITIPLLREFALLSRSKFGIATILESFNYGEPPEKARVRMVPEVNKEREHYLATRTLNTIDESQIALDIQDEGYRTIFYWFDKVVSLYERLGVEFDAQERQQPVQEDLDLFAWAELDSSRPKALTDKYAHAASHGLTIYYASPRQLRTARLMLYLHLINSYQRDKLRFADFPNLDNTFKPRPRVLDSDRRWMEDLPIAAEEEENFISAPTPQEQSRVL